MLLVFEITFILTAIKLKQEPVSQVAIMATVASVFAGGIVLVAYYLSIPGFHPRILLTAWINYGAPVAGSILAVTLFQNPKLEKSLYFSILGVAAINLLAFVVALYAQGSITIALAYTYLSMLLRLNLSLEAGIALLTLIISFVLGWEVSKRWHPS
ncbi:MAG: hypothetical protein DI585_05980 [Pseudomonas fluorescens]|nr:MAG: hypothetical protein DI585_05980 [Pseudomonas fluorescens]